MTPDDAIADSIKPPGQVPYIWCTCGSSWMYSMVLSTATISCSVSAEVVSTPFRISVIDSA